MSSKKKRDYAIYISIGAFVVALFSLAVSWNQSEFMKTVNSPPDIVACITSFSYSKGFTYGEDQYETSYPEGIISFELVNKGSTDATVIRVDVTPLGIRQDGKEGWIWMTIHDIAVVVPAKSSTKVENLEFEADNQVPASRWIDEPENVFITAFWPDGTGSRLTCNPDSISRTNEWFCGYPKQEGGYTGENACR